MTGPRFARLGSLVVAVVLLSPAVSSAQSAIAGLVTDTTGAILPGVTVEARSPALIEQTRTVVSDGNGRYRIEDLRPGTYSVTFSLPGFSHFVREGIVLESNFTAPINAQLKVGSLEETVTVSGQSPVVDVQSTQSRTVLSKEQMEVLPSGRSYQSLAATIPALGSATAGRFDVGGSTQMWQGTVVAYGSQAGDMALEVDGMNVASILSTGQISGIYHNQSAYEEMSYQVVAGSAESQTGGVRINMIPKQGGNRFTWDAVVTYTNENLQAENNDAELMAKGLVVPPNLYSGEGLQLLDRRANQARPRVVLLLAARLGCAELHPEPVFPGRVAGPGRIAAPVVHDPHYGAAQFEAQGHGAVRSAAETPRLLPERDGPVRSEGLRRAEHVQPRHPGQVDVDDDEPPARRSRLLGELHGIQARRRRILSRSGQARRARGAISRSRI